MWSNPGFLTNKPETFQLSLRFLLTGKQMLWWKHQRWQPWHVVVKPGQALCCVSSDTVVKRRLMPACACRCVQGSVWRCRGAGVSCSLRLLSDHILPWRRALLLFTLSDFLFVWKTLVLTFSVKKKQKPVQPKWVQREYRYKMLMEKKKERMWFTNTSIYRIKVILFDLSSQFCFPTEPWNTERTEWNTFVCVRVL